MLIDANSLSSETLVTEVCIVGGGPAGITLARQLAAEGLRVLVAESGGIASEEAANQLNAIDYTSNFTYRPHHTNRCRQVGGTANLWAGRVVSFQFHPVLDREWGTLPALLEASKSRAHATLGIAQRFVAACPVSEGEVVSLWGKKIERFNRRSTHLRAGDFELVYHLTYRAKATERQGRFTAFEFQAANGRSITVEAAYFVLAAGGIENARTLLLMEEVLKPRMGANFRNVGKYLMDHPKIVHGSFYFENFPASLQKLKMQVAKEGKLKYGLKRVNPRTGVRAYANLIETEPTLLSKWFTQAMSLYKRVKKNLSGPGALPEPSQRIPSVHLESKELIPHAFLYRLRSLALFSKKKDNWFRVVCYVEQRPEAANRMVLRHDTPDAHGLPTPELHMRLGPEAMEEAVQLYRDLQRHMAALGGTLTFQEQALRTSANYTDASHHLGGTRYSIDRDRAVVDESLRVIGCPNLFVVGSSVFPTGSVENPTHLIVNLAHYLASVIVEEHRTAALSANETAILKASGR
ncbi:Choline dehydrogenase [Catalinimonas alkaloidigena]|uniref:Choline dehydrogenase n=1 Tax=Catalinimonas alkaloidigena TaxID=1075417 RepID=A0A1G9IR59_9BACT|nr:FAD-dependent oxidoreductase [Catalinimonas alkaloidigena]SDL27506.1 Choline dehydrogenase [Catalinimonas alkaloidigena]